jgi:hypothetical protein
MYPDFEGLAEFAQRVQANVTRLREVIRQEGIKAD